MARLVFNGFGRFFFSFLFVRQRNETKKKAPYPMNFDYKGRKIMTKLGVASVPSAPCIRAFNHYSQIGLKIF